MRRRLAIAAGVCALLLLAGGANWFRLQDYARRQIRQVLVEQLTRALHRPVEVGDLEREPGGAFALHQLVIAGDSPDRPLLTAEKVTAWVDFWDLILRRKVIVQKLRFDGPRVVLTPAKAAQPPIDHAGSMQSLAETGLEEIVIDKGEFTYDFQPNADGGRALKITGLSGQAGLSPAQVRVDLKARDLALDPLRLSDLILAGTWTRAQLQIDNARARLAGQELTASGRWALASGQTELSLGGRVSTKETLSRLAPSLKIPLEGVVDAQLKFRGQPERWEELSGSLTLISGQFKAGADTLPLQQGRAMLRATPQRVEVSAVQLKTDALSLEGVVNFGAGPESIGEGTPYEVKGTVHVFDWKKLRKLSPRIPAAIQSGQLTLQGKLTERLPKLPGRMGGTFALSSARVNAPSGKGTAHRINGARGAFDYNGKSVTLRDTSLEMDGLSARGSLVADLRSAATPFVLRASAQGSDLSAVAARFLGSMPAGGARAGAFAIRTVARGSANGVHSADGSFNVSRAQVSSPAVELRNMSGMFHQKGDQLRLDSVRYQSGDVTGSGAVSLRGSNAFSLFTALNVPRLEGLRRFHPALSSLTGGSGKLQLNGTGRLDRIAGATWNGRFTGQDGVWRLEKEIGGANHLRFDKFAGVFRMLAGQIRLDDLMLAGNQIQMDGQGEMAATGRMMGNGRARLARDLVLQIAREAIPEHLVQQIDRVQLSSLPLRFRLSGSMQSPKIRWQLDDSAIKELSARALDILKPKLKKEADKAVLDLLKKSLPKGEDAQVDEDRARQILKKPLEGLLQDLLKKERRKREGE